nr:capsular biosynthesis protein [Rhizobium halophytocola]
MRRLSLLLLQGPASPFLKEVAKRVENGGGQVYKINVSIGDAVFWSPRGADWFKGKDTDWPTFLRGYIRQNAITDILMLGDGRPRHAAAVDIARELGVKAHIFEHGYLRPDWLTIEPFGMSSESLFPDQPSEIRALAARAVPPPPHAPFRYSFLTYALFDLAYHLPNVFLGWLVHPHYTTHGAVHPLVEYAGWLGKAFSRSRRRRVAAERAARYLSDGSAYYLFPLQLPGDYQILRHAPIGDHFKIVEAVIRSFARSAPGRTRLLFKIHPIDNGLSDWERCIRDVASTCGIGARVDVIDGGDLDSLVGACAGVVTINSTVGLTAILAGCPVIALGAAIYDIPGLTAQTDLATFWNTPVKPDSDLAAAFRQALTATVQVPGGFIGQQAMATGAKGIVERMTGDDSWTDEDARQRRRTYRYESELLALLDV